MIFGFGKKRDEEEEADEQEDVEYVLFQGAFNGREANLSANARLAQAALIPTKELISDALRRRAEQLRIEPKGDRALVQLSIDGVAHAPRGLSKQQGHAVTQMMKLLSGLDIQQRQRPQSGGVRAELAGTKYELRVVSTPLAGGAERLLVKVRNVDRAPKSPEEAGFSKEMKAKVRELTGGEHKGVILVCGGPSSGVSTTTFAVLRSVDAYQFTVFTIGDRQGWDLPNVGVFEPLEGEDLDSTLSRVLRSEGDVIYLDPLRDSETAQIVLGRASAASFISEFAAPDCVHAVGQFAKLVGSHERAAAGLAALISQKLIRTLCKDCKLAYRPNPKIVAKIGLPPETKTLYRAPAPPKPVDAQSAEEIPEPCQTCGGTGYLGRTAMFELLEMTDSMRALAAAGASPQELKTQARKEKMLSFQQEGLKLVVEGKTSLEELQRVFQTKK